MINNMTKPVVLLVRNAARGDFGGAERYPISLAVLIETQAQYTPIVVTRSQQLLEHASRSSVATIRGWWWSKQNWNGRQLILFPLYLIWQALLTCWYVSLLVRTGARAIHLQSKDDFIAGTLAGKIAGRTVVWTDHMDLRYIFENISRPLKNPLGKLVFWCAKLADHVIIISDNERSLVTRQLRHPDALDSQIIVIKNGVIDTLDHYPRHTTPDDEVHFCIASRMVVSKGVGDCIVAFTQLDNPKVHLDIYGDGADLSLFQQVANLHPRIHFHGHTDEPLQAIRDSDAFILPSYHEGLSIALLEAVMLGATVIASDVDSNPEVITHKSNGLLVQPKQPEELAAAMRTLLDHPNLRAQYGHAARETYLQRFNLETIVRNEIQPLYATRSQDKNM